MADRTLDPFEVADAFMAWSDDLIEAVDDGEPGLVDDPDVVALVDLLRGPSRALFSGAFLAGWMAATGTLADDDEDSEP